jgi:hypothetical protein
MGIYEKRVSMVTVCFILSDTLWIAPSSRGIFSKSTMYTCARNAQDFFYNHNYDYYIHIILFGANQCNTLLKSENNYIFTILTLKVQ